MADVNSAISIITLNAIDLTIQSKSTHHQTG